MACWRRGVITEPCASFCSRPSFKLISDTLAQNAGKKPTACRYLTSDDAPDKKEAISMSRRRRGGPTLGMLRG